MDIKIMTKDVYLTAADKKYIGNRIYFDLAANQQNVERTEVSLCAIRGFESERLHHCRVEVRLLNGNAVIGDSNETDIFVTIDRAIERACSRVSSSIGSQEQTIGRNGVVASANSHPGAAAYGQALL